MADTFKGIITADGKKRQLPYGAVLETPVSDKTLSKEGGFADAKVVGDNFAKTDSETASLKEDLKTLATHFKSNNLLDFTKIDYDKTYKGAGSSYDDIEDANWADLTPYIQIDNTEKTKYAFNLIGIDQSNLGNVRLALYVGGKFETAVGLSYENGVCTADIASGYKGFRVRVPNNTVNYEKSDIMLYSMWTGTHEPYGVEYNKINKPYIGESVEEISNYYGIENLVKFIQINTNPLYNKKIAWFGDSLSDYANFSWSYLVPKRNDMISTSFAVSGSTISYIPDTYGYETNDKNSICFAIETHISEVKDNDYIIFSGGYNDGARGSGYPDGAITDINDFTGELDKKTFAGALEQCCRKTLSNCLGKKIGFIIACFNADNKKFYTNKYPIIIEVLGKYGIPYLDLCKQGGLNGCIDEINNGGYFKSTNGVGDRTHPTEKGYTLYLINKVESWLRTL